MVLDEGVARKNVTLSHNAPDPLDPILHLGTNTATVADFCADILSQKPGTQEILFMDRSGGINLRSIQRPKRLEDRGKRHFQGHNAPRDIHFQRNPEDPASLYLVTENIGSVLIKGFSDPAGRPTGSISQITFGCGRTGSP